MLITNFDAKTRNELSYHPLENFHRYIGSGKKVSEREIKLLIKREQAETKKKVINLANDLLDEKINFDDWQKQTAVLLKDGHVDAARLGRGGKERTYGIHYLDVANQLKNKEYPSLRKLSEDLTTGKISEAQFKARLNALCTNTKISYEKAKLHAHKDNGQQWAMRTLGNCDNHCNDCLEYASQGWQRIQDVVPIGSQCVCGGNCQCNLITSDTKPN